MFWNATAGALAALLTLSTPAVAGSAGDSREGKALKDGNASIPFAGYSGRIRDWRAEGRYSILIQADSGQWYRAEFMSPCHNLPFTETIGFVLDARREIDKFGSIVVRGAGGLVEECWFKSFEKLPGPGPDAD